MLANRADNSRAPKFAIRSDLRALADDRTQIEIDACCAEANRLASLSEDELRKRALLASFEEFKLLLKRLMTVLERRGKAKGSRAGATMRRIAGS